MQNELKVESKTQLSQRRALEGILGYGKTEWDTGT